MNEHKSYVIIAVIVAFAAIFYFFEDSKTVDSTVENFEMEDIKREKETEEQQNPIKEPENIIVDVKGQVKMPGVYSSSQGERVIDVINRAGGLTENADETQVNFAEHVQDAMVIYIPAKGEAGTGPAVTAATLGNTNTGNDKQAKINLNKADETQLQNLPGVGPSKAAAIIEYRETIGRLKVLKT